MNAEYDTSSSGPEETDSGHHTVVGSVLGRFGVHSGDADRPATGTLADSDSPSTAEPATEESDRPLTGTLADPVGPAEPAESADPADPGEPDAEETDRPLTGTLADPADAATQAEPATVATGSALTGTLADPDETDPALTGTTADPAGAHESFSQSADPSLPPAAAGASEPSMSSLDGPLIGDAAALRGNWQHLQAGFVDDPRAAVGDAAELVEHAAQVLVGTLQQRQRSLREMWDGGTTTGSDETADTERLRLVMRRYRALFNEICPP